MASTAPADARQPGPPAPRHRWSWWAALVILLLAIAAVGAYLLTRQPEIVYRSVPGPGPDARQVDQLEQARTRAGGLREQLAALLAEIEQALCPPGTVPGSSPPSGTAPLPRTDAPATGAGALQGAAQPLQQRLLVARLNQAVVLVLTEKSSASGFFVAPGYIVTNRHVAADADAGRLWITSKALGRVQPGQVIAMSPGGPSGSPDYAIVRVEGAGATAMLPLTSAYEALTPIISAGYPGLTVMNDAGFRALIAGDPGAAPELVLSRGEVQAVQKSPAGEEVVVHSGDIQQGSSGGPVIDACGRVVGINTYIAVDAQQSGKVSYALAARGIDGFLRANRFPIALDPAPCP